MSSTTPSQDRVLDAFERAIVAHGVQGASFARIAAEGDFHRSLVQHHFANRDALLNACVDRLVAYYLGRLDEVDNVMEWLMSPHGPDGPVTKAKVVDAFIATANTDEKLARKLGLL